MEMRSAPIDNDWEIGAPDLHCFARTIHLITKESALRHCAVSGGIDKLRAVGNHFSKSAESHSALKKIQGARNLDLLQFKNDVATRCGGTHDMIERALNIKPALTSPGRGDYGACNTAVIPLPRAVADNGWATLGEVQAVLSLLREAT